MGCFLFVFSTFCLGLGVGWGVRGKGERALRWFVIDGEMKLTLPWSMFRLFFVVFFPFIGGGQYDGELWGRGVEH